MFFFFQAEDGIRDYDVTGVQTCALPIYLCPADLTDAEETYLQTIAMEAFRATGASGWGRVDFIIDKDKTPYLLEINTVPGMTSHSLVPMAAKAAGMTFEQLVLSILHG